MTTLTTPPRPSHSTMKKFFPLRSLSLVAAACALSIAACASDEILGTIDPQNDAGPTFDAGATPDAYRAECGNGVLDPGEPCDDGNKTSGDGCSSTCQVEAASSCPGTTIPLTPAGNARRGSVSDDTSTGASTMASDVCGGGNGKDLVYAFTTDVAGRARVRLDASFAAILAVRKTCAAPSSEVACKQVAPAGGSTEIALPMAANETAYVIVDGTAGQSGAFTIDIEVSAAYCGDGVATYPEQCDDGNTTAGDGCSASCRLEGPDPGVGTCPGIGYTFVGNPAAPKTVSFAGDLSLLSNTMGAFGCGGMLGKDQAYAITPTIDGALSLTLHAQYPNAAVHVRRECFSSATEANCGKTPTGPLHLDFAVSKNQTYTIFVDTESNATFPTGGLYTMELTLSPPSCGDGILQVPEQCDDGNTAAGDGCSATCTLEPYPAGLDTCPGALMTFAGDADVGPLTYRHTASTATLTAAARNCATTNERKDAVYRFVPPFDGWVRARAKGDFNLSLDLKSACVPQSSTNTGTIGACGNADGGNGAEIVQGAVVAGTTYYVVVDGPNTNANLEGPFTLDVELTKAVCGNGRIEGGEACDDGNTTDGDTCSATCQIEPLGNPSRNTCAEAELLDLEEESPGVYATSVKGGNWNLTSNASLAAPCGATTGADAFFKLVPPIDGVLQVDVDATYDITPALRSSDTAACPLVTGAAFLICSNKTSGPGGERFAYPVTTDKHYWIILDSSNLATQRGAFTMDVKLKAEDCGDGVVGGTEECDDGNLANGDGCSATCKLEPLAGANTCPGYAVAITGVGGAVREKVVTLSTASMTSSYSGTCGGSSRDGVIKVTSDITGTMNAQLEALWGSVLYAREICTDGSTQLGCSAFNPQAPNRTLRDLSFPVVAGVPTYLFIDGLSGESGPGTLLITVTP
ncbi:MAG: DUF4215 domain-containing protein [Labilithrix sp.]|nr:DUF4215 domain-containing protein [Labilithrix sp.]